jgi:hypothetical protein
VRLAMQEPHGLLRLALNDDLPDAALRMLTRCEGWNQVNRTRRHRSFATFELDVKERTTAGHPGLLLRWERWTEHRLPVTTHDFDELFPVMKRLVGGGQAERAGRGGYFAEEPFNASWPEEEK